MKQRCARDKAYALVSICDRWSKFENFLADMGERPEGTTLDRIDNELGYFPENCRWATHQTQTENRRVTLMFEDKPLKSYCEENGMNYPIVYKRVQRGWSISRAVKTPLRQNQRQASSDAQPPIA